MGKAPACARRADGGINGRRAAQGFQENLGEAENQAGNLRAAMVLVVGLRAVMVLAGRAKLRRGL